MRGTHFKPKGNLELTIPSVPSLELDLCPSPIFSSQVTSQSRSPNTIRTTCVPNCYLGVYVVL